MDIKRAYSVYFSPTGTTERAVTAFTKGTGAPYETFNLTTPEARQSFKHLFGKNELLVAGMPVYRGRLPTHLDDFFGALKGNSTLAVAIIVYGNREYEDALIELKMRLEDNGFNVKAGAAFIGEHTYSKNIAAGRPDENDLAIAAEYGNKVAAAIINDASGTLRVKGNYPFVAKGYDPALPAISFPPGPSVMTTEDCTSCGLCAENCPWGAIDRDNPVVINNSICSRCFRCIKYCPVSAKKAAGEQFLTFIPEFEKRLNARRKEPELFLPG